MATVNSISDSESPALQPSAKLLVFVSPMAPDQLEGLLGKLADTFAPEELLVATPDELTANVASALRIVPLPDAKATWTLTAADFVSAYQLAQKHSVGSILMLGPEAGSLTSTSLHDLAKVLLNSSVDLAIPCYDLPPHAGLVNSAILYPSTRALFASKARYPLAIDLGLSIRMAERLATASQRFTAINQGSALIWPINEAVAAAFTMQEVEVGTRTLPQPPEPDLNSILPLVTGSLFSDIDAKAAFWQRARALPGARNLLAQPLVSSDVPSDIASMLDAFRLAYTNLREIWSLVLPPNSLLGLKRLSITDAATFRMPDNLWARIVYDFLLAYRLRTINRGHLLGALIPLYLAWVASHINITGSGTDTERHIEAVAAAFEAEKPYLLARWRWPDRFNP
jgi:hypothetical protein